MNRHLSSERIAGWVAGECAAEDERHVRECAACRTELERLAETFALFRESGARWSEHWSAAPAGSGAAGWDWRRLAIAGAMAASLLAGALWLQRPTPVARADAPFLEIPYLAPLAPYERVSVMRLEVPVAELVAAGFVVHGTEPGGTVTADVLVGQDGRARAFRLISNRSVLQ
jgi:hypothetical protein